MPSSARRRSQAGFTLVEMLVAIALLATIVGAMAGAFQIGLKSVGSGGAQVRAAGAHDLSSFEQQLSLDVARAGCVTLGATPYGACAQSVAPGGTVIATCRAAVICLAWSQYSGTNSGCQVDAFTQSGGAAGGSVVRNEYLASNWSTTIAHVNVTTTYGVTKLTPTTTPASPSPPSGVSWISQLQMSITSLPVPASLNPPTAVLIMSPVTADPGGQAETVLC